MNTNNISLENKLKKFMHEYKLTVRKFCEVIGMSSANLYDVYRRNNIDTKYLRIISEKYKVPMWYFFVNDEQALTNNNNNSAQTATEKTILKNEVKALKKEVKLLTDLVDTKDLLIDELMNSRCNS